MSAGHTPIRARDLTAGFPGRVVIESVNLSAGEGEVVVIAGPNGAGKSTLLKTMARLITPLSGSVTLGDDDIFTMSARDFSCRVAFVPQQSSASIRLTVNETVALGRNPHQSWWQWQPTAKDRTAIENALSITGLSALKDKLVAELSGGERQRASVAMALAQDPQFLLMDEPTSHLDFRHQIDLLNLIVALKKKGTTAIVVLHDLNFAYRIADRIVMVERGSEGPSRVAAAGSPDEVLTPEMIGRIYDVDMKIIDSPEEGGKIFVLLD